MGKPPRMTNTHARKIRALIRRLCANYDRDDCLLLDDGESCVCPQMLSRSLLCRYFRTAVLPVDPDLYTAVVGTEKTRLCAECGQLFIPAKRNTQYCKSCAIRRVRRSKREWAAKNRGQRRKSKAENA